MAGMRWEEGIGEGFFDKVSCGDERIRGLKRCERENETERCTCYPPILLIF
ncbi:MAG: hypothetical protein GDA54_04435 [Alphaproteobacteria bacterium GM7ARS4]|nr:hypothetical protein [Alphaproteobacteria bacterium GM7ARS4]